MNPSDAPTEKQIFALFQEYAATIYGAALTAKERGAYIAADAIESLLDTKILIEAVRKIPTRRQMSIAIYNALKCPKDIHPLVMREVEKYLAPYDFSIEAFFDGYSREDDSNAKDLSTPAQ